MKIVCFFLLMLISFSAVQAQSIPKRAEERSKQKVGHKVDESVDKGVDSAFSKTGRAIVNVFKKKDKKKKADEPLPDEDNTQPKAEQAETAEKKTSKVNAKGDFVAGEKLLFEDAFEKDAEGDFPAHWNTNGSGRVVTIDGVEGKWLEVAHNSLVNPVLNKALPENSTIEFDLFLKSEEGQATPFIQFGLTNVKDLLKEYMFYKKYFFVSLSRYDEKNGKMTEYGLDGNVLGNKSDFPLLSFTNKVLHVAMSVNKTRIRVYLDGQKIIDLPKALTDEYRNTFFINNNYTTANAKIGVLVSNLRIASAETDARSLLIKQLMEDGKVVTNDILFDVNSDVIKKESYSVINQFGEALQQNATLKIKITGHTDSDGADAANLTLSQKRAAAVKSYITENFAVAGVRIQTDGKGEAQPVQPNTTADGKAKNRRVEFTKL